MLTTFFKKNIKRLCIMNLKKNDKIVIIIPVILVVQWRLFNCFSGQRQWAVSCIFRGVEDKSVGGCQLFKGGDF